MSKVIFALTGSRSNGKTGTILEACHQMCGADERVKECCNADGDQG